ncbi:bifunctional phosphoribosylaminoimidazolecarboxamide formyltransferase/IMP cyclohydrolase [Dehalogenimonas alkenigignens]|uniref:Bifunctional purine biosynthesis protein PurH n=1 Tax=Dehalogenimonas alkenigignens TaxID=1217799 RepID=A0A0W0GG87_9CHLR|nr:bifunctional phosphoribosylaminoimidazolecarboxamide formyltransferase/IMP cyclohydrolase [Dehalogenimonas alkenigignens]KTB47575.1 phosphoribosylaminoimidazolecarboxamide formyltransferase/IMP cyclohydrolase [Dehalogenimonas alkenigignens]PVV82882.1 bifunctional phosphoribosylaminoimidazolecarboxamide formyltransferase/IMP cyclohydrolase PurH [Dehalogenimonas alkenigignens]
MRAILSVSDKTGLEAFAVELGKLGWEIFSTGGTKKSLTQAGVPVHAISDITGFPEILDGRVKTLHPMVHGGILARRDKADHMSQLSENKITPIDMVVVNLYPFVQTVSRAGVSLEEALENIDIGGPAMIRASAKNYPGVIIVTDPADYPLLIEKLRGGGLSPDERKRLAQKAFQHTAMYDTAIAQYLWQGSAGFPDNMTLALKKRYNLRYGENPHQAAAFYAEHRVGAGQNSGITWAEQLWGKELSFNNILDADAAWATATDFEAPTVAIVKHTNPCGLASRDDVAEAYQRAFEGDPVSAYGGIVAVNRTLTAGMAEAMRGTFYEISIAPDYEEAALVILRKRKDLRILKARLPAAETQPALNYRHVKGGLLVQQADALPEDQITLKPVTRRQPTKEEYEDLRFAFRAVKHIKSNAIVLVKDKMLLGMGAGQPNRVTSVDIAVKRAGEKAKGSVMASDAMFPFNDSVLQAAAAGIAAIVQPGGSIRDEDSIKAADENGIAMVVTGVRHFLH